MSKFFAKNPQLKCLEIINTPLKWIRPNSKRHCSDFGIQHLTDLEEFSYKAYCRHYSSYDCFGNLTKLKRLRLYVVDNDKSIVRDILKSLLKAEPPLETLWLYCNNFNYYTDKEIVELICQFKSIQRLVLKQCVLNGHLLEILNELPRLKSIYCEFQKTTTQEANRLERFRIFLESMFGLVIYWGWQTKN